MKRVKTIKQVGIRQSLLLAGLVLASAGAQAAVLPKITVTGVVGDSMHNVNGYTGSITYDPGALLGKNFTLELTYDAAGAIKTTEEIFPGEFSNIWRPVVVDYRLTIDGVLAFSGVSDDGPRIEAVNDLTVPVGLDLTDAPPGIIAGHTYDAYTVGTPSTSLACFSGGTNGKCDGEPTDVYEGGGIVFDYYWDTATYQGLTDTNLPNPQSLNFTQGFGGADFNIGHWSADPSDEFDGNDLARIYLTANSVTVAVPEPETYAMLLAGLGLVGFAVRRRATSRA
jgi:hypothetical protein